jgi:malonate decarboxylase delta subunit
VKALHFRFPADREPERRSHVGVVASGDLEILFEPARHETEGEHGQARVRVRTSVEGFDEIWHLTLERFFAHTPLRGNWELNDFAATPAVVTLRLRQAAEAAMDADQEGGRS